MAGLLTPTHKQFYLFICQLLRGARGTGREAEGRRQEGGERDYNASRFGRLRLAGLLPSRAQGLELCSAPLAAMTTVPATGTGNGNNVCDEVADGCFSQPKCQYRES